MFSIRAFCRAAVWALLGTAVTMPVLAQDGFSLSGEARARYESLDGQFRAGRSGSDQALFLRTLVHGRYEADGFAFGIELQDSRAYLDDEGTPLSASYVNPLDILQLYAETPAAGLLGPGWTGALRLGRQTVSIGSKRQIERVSYANVIKSYTGAHYTSRTDAGDEFHLLAVVPLSRQPSDRGLIGDNTLSGDEEQWNRQIWGVHYRDANAFPGWAEDIMAEAFIYGLSERDSSDFSTPNRQYTAPGFRLYRRPQTGQWDMDIEGVWRFGSRRATSSASDTDDLDVSATMLFAAAGYTFDAPWKPRLALEYYWASGDDDPNDENFDQYERLFGSRRTDLNNTSLHGPLTPANLSAPGVRLELDPGPRWSARVHYSHASLASETDSWVIAKLRDPSGQSGNVIGQTIDSRVVYDLVPERLELELGASVFLPGAFADNAPASPAPDETLFGYAQVAWRF
ncbi:alginate export family protein [Maricaulis sp.]|uniref:alginate export family protein n=1 Tax=Maricaulis sp. TaxID=1486257 RepID=UPI002606C702|nr:alginate export family protein [Maricaulis sp.]